MINTIAQVRRTLGSAANLIKAVRSDFQGVFNGLRQISLALKDLVGVAVAAGDLPRQVINDLKDTIEEVAGNTESAVDFGFQLANKTLKDLAGGGAIGGSLINLKNISSSLASKTCEKTKRYALYVVSKTTSLVP